MLGMEGVGKWIAGAAIGLAGILGLFLSAKAHDSTFYYLGLGIFVACVLIIGAMIKRQYDMQDRAH